MAAPRLADEPHARARRPRCRARRGARRRRVVWLPGALGGKGAPSAARTAQAASAYQQDRPLPTGLSTTRKATVDPQAGTVALSITYAAQAATLRGPLLEVVPGVGSRSECPAVTWTGDGATGDGATGGDVTGVRNQPSLTGVDVRCGWTLSDVVVRRART